MSSLHFLQTARLFTNYGTLATVTVNSLLVHLTLNYVKNITPFYKILIVFQAILGIIFSLTEAIVHPFMHSFNASFIYFSTAFGSGKFLALKNCILGFYSLTYMFVICCLSIQFIYRYLLVLKPKKLKLFKGWKSLIWLGYSLIFIGIWVIALIGSLPDKYSNIYLKDEIGRNYDADINYVASYQIVTYDQNGSLRWNSFITVLEYSLVLSTLYIVITYCGFRIHFGIKAIIDVSSARTHRLHTQLFKTLVLQITVPSVFFNSPVFLLYIAPFLDIKWSVPSGIMVCFFSFYPAVDSLILMYMVADYNRTLRKWMTKVAMKLAEWLASSDVDEEETRETGTDNRNIMI